MVQPHQFNRQAIIWVLLVHLLITTSCITSTTTTLESVRTIDPRVAPNSNESLAAISTAEKTVQPTRQVLAVPSFTPINENYQDSIEMQVVRSTKSPDTTRPISRAPTANPQIVDTATRLALADPIDRSCPDPAPGKPDYNHYYLSGKKWPEPSGTAASHFWLTKPFPWAGRFLYTDWYPYGYDGGGGYLLHNGVDSAEDAGTPVIAVADGIVVVAGSDKEKLYGWRCDWYGNLVVLELNDRWNNQPIYVLYGHILEISVTVGQSVKRGDQIAEVGVGGVASAPHLHLEVRVGNNDFNSTRNPLLWLAPPESRGLIVGRLVDPHGRPWQGVSVLAIPNRDNADIIRTWTYLDDPNTLINPDEVFAENFVMADLLPGEYDLYAEIQGETYSSPITVRGGEITQVVIETLPFKWSESDNHDS